MQRSVSFAALPAVLGLAFGVGPAPAAPPFTSESLMSACVIAHAGWIQAPAQTGYPSDRMGAGENLAANGQYAAALKEYLWCLDNGNKIAPAFRGVRLSFLLSDIKDLGAHYPPAIDALKARRDAARSALEHGFGDRDKAMDFSSYNEYLDQKWKTLEEYGLLKLRRSPATALVRDEAIDLLIEKRRYADLAPAVDLVVHKADFEVEIYHRLASLGHADPSQLASQKKRAVGALSSYYEALIGMGKREQADVVRDKLLAFDGEPAAYAALVKCAVRAGKLEVVKQLLALAQRKLSPWDFRMVQKAATP